MGNEKQVVAVVGAAGGMGSATVARLSRDGFRVAALDINADGLHKVVDGVDDAASYVVDVTVEEESRKAIEMVEREHGPIYALVNLVGWCETHPFAGEESNYWRKVMALNFDYILFLTHAVLPGMIDRRSGRIINVASDAGRVGQGGEAVYAAAKGAVIAFTKSLARELARYGINANCTSPGPTDTPLEAAQDPEVIRRVVRLIPYRRMATPDEQAGAISFLCSPDAGFITGQTLSVNGGLSMC
jgi:2-hydroxycyclohexanecarboxyl-CoA dehydrogenase